MNFANNIVLAGIACTQSHRAKSVCVKGIGETEAESGQLQMYMYYVCDDDDDDADDEDMNTTKTTIDDGDVNVGLERGRLHVVPF